MAAEFLRMAVVVARVHHWRCDLNSKV